MSEWQPIETAPKDGTVIVVITSDGDALTAWWNDAVPNFYKSQEGWACYDPDNARGDWVSWQATTGDEHHRLYCGSTPALWMARPELPSD